MVCHAAYVPRLISKESTSLDLPTLVEGRATEPVKGQSDFVNAIVASAAVLQEVALNTKPPLWTKTMKTRRRIKSGEDANGSVAEGKANVPCSDT